MSTDRAPITRNIKAEILATVDLESLLVQACGKPENRGRVKYFSASWRDESSPSVALYPDHWWDYGDCCGSNAIDFYMKWKGLGFVEALRELADECKISWRKPSPEEAEFATSKEEVDQILTDAADWYLAQWDASKPAREMKQKLLLDGYGFTEDAIQKYKIGWAPPQGGLYSHLSKKGYSKMALDRTGLFWGDGSEVFLARVTFPYFDRGKVVYFAARRTEFTPDVKNKKGTHVEDSKYRKLSQSDYVSNPPMWGIDDARRGNDTLVVPEGMPDAISVAMLGFPCCSPITTQFGADDIPVLLEAAKRQKRIVLVPDQESGGAGMKGAVKTATELCSQGLDCRICILPHAEIQADAEAETDAEKKRWKVDANEYIRGLLQHQDQEQATTHMRELFEAAPRFVDALLEQIPTGVEGDELAEHLDPIFQVAAGCSDLEQERIVKALRKRTKVKMRILESMLGKAVKEANPEADDDAATGTNAQKLCSLIEELPMRKNVNDRAFVTMQNEVMWVDSKRFIERMAYQFRLRFKGLASKDTIESAVLSFKGGDIETEEPAIRYAGDDKAVYVDLCDGQGRVVEITGDGARVLDKSPLAFFRPPGSLPLPEPQLPKDDAEAEIWLGCLRSHLGLDDESWGSAFAWLMGVMRKTSAYPVLRVKGRGGTGKTVRVRHLRALVDPRDPSEVGLFKNDEDIHIYCENSHLVFFDNLSRLTLDQSDLLCRIATGGGQATRTLYSPRDLTVFRSCKPIVITGITDVVTQADLLDRSLPIKFGKLGNRLTEEALDSRLAEMRPRVLGALYHFMSKALAAGPVEQDAIPAEIRMRGACAVAAAVEAEAGLQQGSVVKLYLDAREDSDSISSDDPAVGAILDLLCSREGEPWSGTASKLLSTLTSRLDTRPPGDWPRSARGMRAKLDRLADAFEADGIVVEHGKRGGKSGDRILTLSLAEGVAVQESEDEPVTLDEVFGDDDEADDLDLNADGLDLADDLPGPTVSHNPASTQPDRSSADDLTVHPPSSTPSGEDVDGGMGAGLPEISSPSSSLKKEEQPSDRQPIADPGEFGCEVADDLLRQPSANRQTVSQPSATTDPEQDAGEAAPSTDPHLRLVVDNDPWNDCDPDEDECWKEAMEAMARASD